MTEGPYKLPKGWRWVQLGEVCDKPQYGYTQSASPEPVGPKFVRISDITGGNIDWDNLPYCLADEAVLKRYRLAKDDLLFARSGSVGATVLIKEEPPMGAVFASYIIRVRVDVSAALPEFIELFTRSPFGQSQLVARGAAQKNINAKRIQELSVPLPPLSEQRRIVARVEELIARVREARRLRQQAREDAERLWQSVLADTFPRPGSDLPAGWRWVRLGEMAREIRSGFAFRKKNPQEGDILHLRPYNIGDDGELQLVQQFFVPITALPSGWSSLKPGDVLFNNTNSVELVGKSALVREELEAAFSNHITLIRVDPVLSEGAWLALSLNALRRQGFFAQRCNKWIGQAGYNTEMLQETPIPLPPLAEQRRIVARVEAVWEKLHALKEAQAETDQELGCLEQAVLDKAFRGEL